MHELTAAARAMHPRLPSAVEVIDCTLRDGEQAPGVWFTPQEKAELAAALSAAGVTVLDAGFPASSPSDTEAMQAMSDLGLRASVAATARPLPGDIAAAAAARADEVFLFMPTSDQRLKQTLGITRDRATGLLRAGAEAAAAEGMTVNLVFEDATRTEPGQLIAAAAAVREHVPLRRLVLADSVGCAHPAAMQRLVSLVDDGLDRSVVLCAHCHNDFGLAAANTLAAVVGGARAITCTVNGIGERAGNADLAECLAALTHLYGVEHGIRPQALPALSAAVERMSGLPSSPLKPVTGSNVYRHESGVHVDAILKDPGSYTFLPPEWTGRVTEFALGKHSGTAQARQLLARAGLTGAGPAGDEELAQWALSEVKAWVSQRDKTGLQRACAAAHEAARAALAGYDPAVLIERCAARQAARPAAGAGPEPVR